jgi:hypothetical protein
MEIDDCTSTTVINGANYCILLIHQTSWMDELNSLSISQVSGLLGFTALIWYVAWAIRAHINLLGHYEGDSK